MESKRAGIASKDMTMQCWKNIRLDRCLQEAHRTIGLSNPSIVMADIAGMWNVEKIRDEKYNHRMNLGSDFSFPSILSLSL